MGSKSEMGGNEETGGISQKIEVGKKRRWRLVTVNGFVNKGFKLERGQEFGRVGCDGVQRGIVEGIRDFNKFVKVGEI